MGSIRKALPIIGLLLIAVGLLLFGIYHTGGVTLRESVQEKRILVALCIGGAGVLLTLLGFQFRGIGPNFKYYVGYTLMSILVLCALVMIYLIVRNHSHEFDVTEQKMHSLHPRTVEFLRDLEKDVRITAFPAPDYKREIESFLERYSRSSPHVHYQVRNPYKDIKVAKSFAETISLGDIFIETGTRREGNGLGPEGDSPTDYRQKKINAYSARDLTESKLTNAIVEVMRPEGITIYFLKGHGETNLEPGGGGMFGGAAESQASYSGVEQLLKDEMSFGVETLELARKGFVPDDCSLLVCAGPQVDLLPLEAQAIATYLESGGRALLMLDPNERAKIRFDQFERLMARFGVEIKHNMVLERNPLSQLTGDPTILLVGRFGTHQTVENLGEMVQMARVRTIAPLEDRPSTVTVSELMYSSNLSWSEDIEKLRTMTELVLPGADEMRELPLAVAVSMDVASIEADKPMRMVVVGDSDIFEDRFLPNTVRLFVNLVNWLVAREDLIDVPTKRLSDTPIFPSRAQLRTVFTLLVLVFPSVIFFGGLGYVLVRRRVR
ncbi:hypothetical protein AMJ85_08160 [candidate division BRC1 bacterium SM23_51]|nr:MAG: hypothetical protein AMJ85_08160 [candidate division BRC1 bacterium SM23_51]